ncbi:MAG: hypothetical protein Rubg2KO_23400 [Rubricoccaceae bacterium]
MPLGAFAQSISVDSTGQIVGLVTDASTGGALPRAVVHLRELWVGAYVDSVGHFVVEDVPPGVYTVEVSYAGFKTQTYEMVLVKAGEEVRLEAGLVAAHVGTIYWHEPPLISKVPYASRIITTEFGDIGFWRWW